MVGYQSGAEVLGEIGEDSKKGRGGPKVVEMLYRSVTQAVLLFGSATWVLSAAMERTVEGTHIGFLRKITGKRAWREEERT